MRMVVTCAGCQRPIVDKFLLNVLDQVWHDTCVQCSDCKRPMADKCFSREGKIYCRDDFFKRYGAKCSGCFQGISPHDLVRKAMNRFYHLKCFTCMVCRRKLSTGEELYVLDETHFLCKHDYVRQKTFDADDVTSEPEVDPYSSAAVVLTSGTNDSSAYDLSDNCIANDFDDEEEEDDDEEELSRFQASTTGCTDDRLTRGPLAPSKLTPDEEEEEENLFTPEDSRSLKISRGPETTADLVDMEASNCSSNFSHESNNNNNNNNNNSEKGSEVKDGGSSGENSLPLGSAVGAKRRGPRTTIKAKQLETLKAAFAATPKPTRHIREQLAQETGLNMRVIQVWFQNRRSKERRLKQLSVLGARRQFFRSPRRLRLFRAGDELIETGPHDHMAAAAAAAAAAFGYFAGAGGVGDGADFFPGYAPIYGDFYPGPGSIDPSNGSPAGPLAFLPASSGIGHQPNLSATSSHVPVIPHHLHDQLFHDRLREGVYLNQRHSNPEGMELPAAGETSPDPHHQPNGPGSQPFQSLVHQEFSSYGNQVALTTMGSAAGEQMPPTALERLRPPQGTGRIQPPPHSQVSAVATW